MNLKIGLIAERKAKPDTRVALSPKQCAAIMNENPNVKIIVEPSESRCFTDLEYQEAGIDVQKDLSDCSVLLGIKEVPTEYLIPSKKYLFFSHTKKKQPYNQALMKALIEKQISMIDYECLTHADGQRILGFGFFAGLVGAHNGLLTFGKKHQLYNLTPAHELGSWDNLVKEYNDLILSNLKIVVTGSGKVAAGILEVMIQLDIDYVEPEDFLENEYDYPVYTHIKGHTLYVRKDNGSYHRDDFHHHPQQYQSLFTPFLEKADVLMNGVYWDKNIPALFSINDLNNDNLRLSVIADISCDINGSIPINIDSTTIKNPVYGVDIRTISKVDPYQENSKIIDLMAVDNLPNELPRDASEHFGQHLEKIVLPELLKENSDIIKRATICENGKLTTYFEYLSDYAY